MYRYRMYHSLSLDEKSSFSMRHIVLFAKIAIFESSGFFQLARTKVRIGFRKNLDPVGVTSSPSWH